MTCCKWDALPDNSYWQCFSGILAYSSWAMAFSSVIFLFLCTATAFFKSHQRFKSGTVMATVDFFCNQALVEFEVCLGSLSCPKVQWLTYFLILQWIHLAFHTLQVSRFCLTVDRVFFSASPDKLVILRAEKFQFLFHRSSEQNPKTSVAYSYDFEHFSCAFGSVLIWNLEFWHGNHMCLLCALVCKLKPQWLLPPSLAAGLLQSLQESRVFLNLSSQKSGCSHW